MSQVTLIPEPPRLPPRPRDGHKGTFGRVLVVAGSPNLSGAAVLCGEGALRGGAGLVQVAVPAPIRAVVASQNPCFMTAALPATQAGSLSAAAIPDLLHLAEWADVVAVGPGLGMSRDIVLLVALLLERVPKPIVLDADGLNALARILETPLPLARTAPLVCTPHPGEFARLAPALSGQRGEIAVAFARSLPCILVLKGAGTVVTDGSQLYQNTTGNAGMGTGGTGDVLTGIIAALMGQRLSPFAAAQLGVYVHGLAGDLAANELGEVSMLATDLLRHLPHAFQLAARGLAGL